MGRSRHNRRGHGMDFEYRALNVLRCSEYQAVARNVAGAARLLVEWIGPEMSTDTTARGVERLACIGPQAAQCARWRRAGALAAADHAHTATRGQPAQQSEIPLRAADHADTPPDPRPSNCSASILERSQYETTTSRLYRVGSGTRKFSQEWHQVNELTSLRWYVSRDVIGMR